MGGDWVEWLAWLDSCRLTDMVLPSPLPCQGECFADWYRRALDPAWSRNVPETRAALRVWHEDLVLQSSQVRLHHDLTALLPDLTILDTYTDTAGFRKPPYLAVSMPTLAFQTLWVGAEWALQK